MRFMSSLYHGLIALACAAGVAMGQDAGRSAEAAALFERVGASSRAEGAVKSTKDLLAQLAAGYAEASAAAHSTADSLDRIAALEPDNAGRADLMIDSLRAIGDSLMTVSKEIADGCIAKPDVFFAVEAAYEQASWTIKVVAPQFEDASALLALAGTAIGEAGWSVSKIDENSGEAFLKSLRDFSSLNSEIGVELHPASAIEAGADAGAARAAAAGCPKSHPYRGCTEYITTTYTGGTCDPWTRLVGGISIGVECVISIGTEICPDGGFFTRTCSFTACRQSKCVCVCYASRWDRFWAVNGVNKTVVVTNLGCTTETFRYYTFSCGAPAATPPAPPARDITITDGPGC